MINHSLLFRLFFFIAFTFPILASVPEEEIWIPQNQKGLEQLTIKTENYIVTIDSLGGKVSSFLHRDSKYPPRDRIELVTEPMWMMVYPNHTSFKRLEKAYFKLTKKETETEILVKASIVNTNSSGGLFEYSKIFNFYKKTHFWHLKQEIKNFTSKTLKIPFLSFIGSSSIGPKADNKSPRSAATIFKFYHKDDTIETITTEENGCMGKSSNEVQSISGNFNYFGESSRFMVMAFQPLQTNSAIYFFPKSTHTSSQIHLEWKNLGIEPQETLVRDFLVYTGPKSRDTLEITPQDQKIYPLLKKHHKDLYQAFDFGFTAPIRDLIVIILQFFYNLIPNYGVGIILFALAFKLVFFQMNQKQAETMKRMGVLSPKMKEINEKYKNNPQEKQKRIMALYKEHGMNPASGLTGCLPMLVQLPIFIALYSAFSDAYELWRSPFIEAWIPDLSEPDTVAILPLPFLGEFPFRILPLLMAITQFFQMKITPVSGDSNQQKVMQFLPIFMLAIFWSMPAGVVLYWTVQNILSIIQTGLTQNKNHKPA